MDKVNDPSQADSGRNDTASDAPSAPLHPDSLAATSPRTPLQQRIEAQRAQLLQAHGVLRCLYEVLLHAECDDAVFYAEAAYVAASLINKSAEELDSVRIWPLIEALASSSDRVAESRDVSVT